MTSTLHSPSSRARQAAQSVPAASPLRGSISASEAKTRPHSSQSQYERTSTRLRESTRLERQGTNSSLLSPSGNASAARPSSADESKRRPVTPIRFSYSSPAPAATARRLSVPVFAGVPTAAQLAPQPDPVAPVEAQVQALLAQKQREILQSHASALNGEQEKEALKEAAAVTQLKDGYARTRDQLRVKEDTLHRYDGHVR